MPVEGASIEVTGGRIAGVASAAGIHRFLGVPYAAPLTQQNRWRPPQPVESWQGVRVATAPGAICWQNTLLSSRWLLGASGHALAQALRERQPQGEDCLSLNIWTPNPDRAARLPVLVFLHGGSFEYGSAAHPLYDGEALATASLVVVTLNYRLGIFGFIGSDAISNGDVFASNRGLLDQVQALEWVRDNIAAFGGDPSRVTLMGQSAGATSAMALSATPRARPLISRVIALSGIANQSHSEREGEILARAVLENLGARTPDELSSVPVQRVLSAQRRLPAILGRLRDEAPGVLAALSPAHGGAFLPVSPMQYWLDAREDRREMVLGTVRDEARILSLLVPLPRSVVPALMRRALEPFLRGERSVDDLVRRYSALAPTDSKPVITEQVMGDLMFRRPTVALADARSREACGATYLFRFEGVSSAGGGVFGAMHGIELAGVFQTWDVFRELILPDDPARLAGDQLHRAVVNFARGEAPLAGWAAHSGLSSPVMVFDREARSEAREIRRWM